MSLRVLQSFPHKIGAGRICDTAWHQAAGVAAAGAELTVFAGVVHRELPSGIEVRTTLSRGRVRIPYSVLGTTRALALHDRIVARALPRLAGRIDVVHVWPLAALETLHAARRAGIPTVLERPNGHTRFAYRVVRDEARRLGVELPRGHEHTYDAARLSREEAEYAAADRLLCPSDFVVETFVDEGVMPSRLMRHTYGYDPARFAPDGRPTDPGRPVTALFAGVCAVRKGLHFALEAWLGSSASATGTLQIAGPFVEAYRGRLAGMLADRSVQVLGPRDDVPELMRRADVLLLPTLEEGSPLVVLEAMASGCVPLVSDVCRGVCRNGANALVHRRADVAALRSHLDLIDAERGTLAALRAGCLAAAPEHTWTAAGRRLAAVYAAVVEQLGDPAQADRARPRPGRATAAAHA